MLSRYKREFCSCLCENVTLLVQDPPRRLRMINGRNTNTCVRQLTLEREIIHGRMSLMDKIPTLTHTRDIVLGSILVMGEKDKQLYFQLIRELSRKSFVLDGYDRWDSHVTIKYFSLREIKISLTK